MIHGVSVVCLNLVTLMIPRATVACLELDVVLDGVRVDRNRIWSLGQALGK